MKTLLITAILGLLVLPYNLATAQGFKHFKLKGDLKNFSQTQTSQGSRRVKSASTQKVVQATISKIVAEKILKINSNNKSIVDNDLPPLLQKIVEIMGTRYNEIGQRETQPLLLNHQVGGGVMNFSGFTWNKPFANFGLWANREIAPDLFSERWIVHDTLLVSVSASTLLTNLKAEDLIDIDEDTIGAFAGISFQRTYHYYHFSETFLKGLVADYSKLFLSFAKFNMKNALDLPPYELMKKEDQFSFNAGGFVNSPPFYGFSARGGVLINVAFENELTVQSLGPADQRVDDEFLRVSVDKKWDVSSAAHLSLQVDFFNLLKLTIMSYDLEYSYGKSNKTHLSFYDKDKEIIAQSKPHKKEFKKLVSGVSDKVDNWKENIVQKDERMSQNRNSKYSFLVLGKIRKKETEQVKVIKNGVEKVFFKHYSQSIKYVQNILSRLFNSVMYRLFEWDTGVRNAAETIKKLTIEYEQTEGIGKTKVDSEKKFSVLFTQEFSASKTHRWIDRLYHKEALRHLSNWTTLDSKVIKMVNDKDLRGPMSLESKIQIEQFGLEYMNQLGEDKVFEVIVDICRTKRKSKWLNPSKRKKMLRLPQFGRSACVKSLGKRYLSYLGEFYKTGWNDITKFRKFVGKFFSKSKNIEHLNRLFGRDNVFVYGQFSAKTKEGIPFSNHFKSGQFRGLGVIDSFMRKDGTTVPVKLIQ